MATSMSRRSRRDRAKVRAARTAFRPNRAAGEQEKGGDAPPPRRRPRRAAAAHRPSATARPARIAWATTPAPSVPTHAAAVPRRVRGTHCRARMTSTASACSHMRMGGRDGGGRGGWGEDAARAVVAVGPLPLPLPHPHRPGNCAAGPPRPSDPGPVGAGVAQRATRGAHALMPGMAPHRDASVAAGAGQPGPGRGSGPGHAEHASIPCEPQMAPTAVDRAADDGADGRGPGLEQAGERGAGRGGQTRA